MKLIVDLDELKTVAKKAEETISVQKKSYNRLKTRIDTGGMNWEGEDAQAFKEKWDYLMHNDGEFAKQEQMLQSYSDYLNKCQKDYSKIKNRAISRAKKLPR